MCSCIYNPRGTIRQKWSYSLSAYRNVFPLPLLSFCPPQRKQPPDRFQGGSSRAPTSLPLKSKLTCLDFLIQVIPDDVRSGYEAMFLPLPAFFPNFVTLWKLIYPFCVFIFYPHDENNNSSCSLVPLWLLNRIMLGKVPGRSAYMFSIWQMLQLLHDCIK